MRGAEKGQSETTSRQERRGRLEPVPNLSCHRGEMVTGRTPTALENKHSRNAPGRIRTYNLRIRRTGLLMRFRNMRYRLGGLALNR